MNIFKSFSDNIKLDHAFSQKENIVLFASEIDTDLFITPEWDEQVFLREDNERDIEFIFLINTINFSYWPDPQKEKWKCNFEEIDYSGAFGLFAALKKALLAGYPLLDPLYLKDLPEADLRKILCEKSEIPMFSERLMVLREIGTNLEKYQINSFSRLLEKAENSAINLIMMLDKYFPSFRDKFIYKGNLYNFYKRAQLICSMLAGRFKGKGVNKFEDIDSLIIFADYRVPQTLRKLGLIKYTAELEKKIETEQFLPEGSAEEIEIRLSSVFAAELLKNVINTIYDQKLVNSLSMDYYLWRTGKTIKEPDFNFHRTRTINY